MKMWSYKSFTYDSAMDFLSCDEFDYFVPCNVYSSRELCEEAVKDEIREEFMENPDQYPVVLDWEECKAFGSRVFQTVFMDTTFLIFEMEFHTD